MKLINPMPCFFRRDHHLAEDRFGLNRLFPLRCGQGLFTTVKLLEHRMTYDRYMMRLWHLTRQHRLLEHGWAPAFWSSVDVIGRAVSMASRARVTRHSRNTHFDITAGASPSLASLTVKVADFTASRISQLKANPIPAPKHGPLIRAIVTWGEWSSASNKFVNA